jgi:hypothetical protein
MMNDESMLAVILPGEGEEKVFQGSGSQRLDKGKVHPSYGSKQQQIQNPAMFPSSSSCSSRPLSDSRLTGTGHFSSSKRNRHQQVGRWDRGRPFARALVLATEKSFEFLFKLVCLANLLGEVECAHGRPVIPPENIDELSGCAGEVKHIFGSNETDLVAGDAGTPKSLNDVVLQAPGHRTDEALRR